MEIVLKAEPQLLLLPRVPEKGRRAGIDLRLQCATLVHQLIILLCWEHMSIVCQFKDTFESSLFNNIPAGI